MKKCSRLEKMALMVIQVVLESRLELTGHLFKELTERNAAIYRVR